MKQIINGVYVDLTQEEQEKLIAERAINQQKLNSKVKLDQIIKLEGQITPRRLRDAILGKDKGWLADIESQIDEIRKELR